MIYYTIYLLGGNVLQKALHKELSTMMMDVLNKVGESEMEQDFQTCMTTASIGVFVCSSASSNQTLRGYRDHTV